MKLLLDLKNFTATSMIPVDGPSSIKVIHKSQTGDSDVDENIFASELIKENVPC